MLKFALQKSSVFNLMLDTQVFKCNLYTGVCAMLRVLTWFYARCIGGPIQNMSFKLGQQCCKSQSFFARVRFKVLLEERGGFGKPVINQ